jgi:Tfp pilus assembly protein PilW
MKRGEGSRAVAGFTLVEALIGAVVTSIVLAALIAGGIALLRSFTATKDYSTARTDQLRVLDYISRDVRRALTVSVTANPARLTLTVPDQYAGADPDRTFRTPTLVTDGTYLGAKYGTNPVTVSYQVNGSNFVRTEAGISTVIADEITDFQSSFDSADPAGKTVATSLTFAPTFGRNVSSHVRSTTSLTSRAVMRNNPKE